jgi:2,4-dienoyl-CoA reductase-like NADH-dependent reductase (Old Yellow Enzyme family)
MSAVAQQLHRVFDPIDIGGITIPNRVVRTAHLTKFAMGGVTDDLIAYHVARAEGGVGLSILEACAVHPSSVLGMTGFDDSVIAGYERLMTAVRPYGMRVFQQLWHGGHVYNPPGGGVPRSASSLPSPISGIPPVPLSMAEIAELVAAYGDAARRAVAGGIDGIEIAAGHGYLVHQFLSPLTNVRDDGYGGTLDSRMRFLVEVVSAVRGAVGPDVPVGIRVGAGQVKGDVSEEELAEVCRRLVARELIDYVNATMGDYYLLHWMMGGMDRPAGYMLPSAGKITTAVTEVPRIVTGRFRTLEEAEQVLRDGAADLVSMVRAHIADHEIVRKTREGRAHEVRPCIACNQGCIARTAGLDHRMACTVNPVVGYERSLSEDLIGRTSTPRKVVIGGGGPAGLEAARTARLRGHEVLLCEAYQQLGGALNLACLAPQMQGFRDITEWLREEVDRLGVIVHTSTYMEAADVLAERPDTVVVATGAEASSDGILLDTPGEPILGIHQKHVLSSVDLLGGHRTQLGSSAVVYDEMGQYEAVAVIEFLLERGVAVTAATRHASLAPLVEATMRLEPALERFQATGIPFRTIPRARIAAVGEGSAVVCTRYGAREVVPADTVVLVTHKKARRGLADTLAGSVSDVRLVGDALSARDLQVAIREGHMAGRTID